MFSDKLGRLDPEPPAGTGIRRGMESIDPISRGEKGEGFDGQVRELACFGARCGQIGSERRSTALSVPQNLFRNRQQLRLSQRIKKTSSVLKTAATDGCEKGLTFFLDVNLTDLLMYDVKPAVHLIPAGRFLAESCGSRGGKY